MRFKTSFLLIGAFISAFSFANTMKNSFDEGRNIGGAAKQSAQQNIKGINANDLVPNMSQPEEARLYTGQGANPQLSSMGVAALQSSEVGQLLTSSSVNNPADNISEESDMIQRSDEIMKNANYLTGGITGKQCINQTLTKSHFTYHFCEKDQEVRKTCDISPEIKWKGSRSIENREVKLLPNTGFSIDGKRIGHGFWRSGKLIFKFTLPEKAIITGYDYHFKNDGGWFHLKNMEFSLFGHTNKVNGDTYRPITVKVRELNIKSDAGHQHIAELKKVTSSMATYSREKFINSTTHYIQIYYQVEVDNLSAEIEWVNSCGKLNLDDAVKMSEECTQEGGSRNFFKDGKTVSLSSDCWHKRITYLVNDASDNECKKYDDNPNCTVGERECISSLNGLCTRFRLKYQCQHTTKTQGVVCGDKFFCSDGSCADLENSKNANFGHAVSQLASLAQAGKDVSMDSANLRAFSGRPLFCRKSGFGYSDCCKDSGWGHKAGLAKCNSEENILGKAKEKKVTIYVGTYCDKKVKLLGCIRRKSSYCAFDNKLARIIQYQGRSGQLGIDFGSAKNPDCRGISVEEMQRLDFNAMDYSDFYEDLEKQKDIPNQDKIINYIRNNISSQLQQ